MRISPSPYVFDEVSPASQLAPPYLTWNVSARAKFPRQCASSICNAAHGITLDQLFVRPNVAGLLHILMALPREPPSSLSHSIRNAST
jgi:hypothetical protein